jgi:virginiamycin B lyase
VADTGTVWFTEARVGKLGRLRDGKFLELSLPNESGRPFGVAIAPDGAVWYTDIKGRLGMIPAEVARSL